MFSLVPVDGNLPHHNHGVPPTKQQHGGESPPAAEGCLAARLAGVRLPEHLPWVLLGLIPVPKEESSVSSAELVFRAPLTLPGQLMSSPESPVQEAVEVLRALQTSPTQQISNAEAASGLLKLQQAEFVYVRKSGVVPPLAPLYQRLYKVLDRREKFFKLEIGGQPEAISVDRLKPHLGIALVPAVHQEDNPRDRVQ